MSTLVVVDGHNVFNDVGRFFESADRDRLQAYVRDWFDVDRLVNASLGLLFPLAPWRDLGIVIFHSRKRLGEQNDAYAISGDAAINFWARQGAATNTSTMLVEVPGAPSGKDVGMDISIVVYLFETADHWDDGVLFTNDADFAPAVWSLRRRGKRVYCSSYTTDAARPLVQSCQSFMPWDVAFLRADRALFEFLSPGGALDSFLAQFVVARDRPDITKSPAGDALQLMPCDDAGTKVLSKILSTSGMDGPYLHQVSSDVLRVQMQDPARPGSPLRAGSGGLVFQGLDRHADLLKTAAWWGRYRAA